MYKRAPLCCRISLTILHWVPLFKSPSFSQGTEGVASSLWGQRKDLSWHLLADAVGLPAKRPAREASTALHHLA